MIISFGYQTSASTRSRHQFGVRRISTEVVASPHELSMGWRLDLVPNGRAPKIYSAIRDVGDVSGTNKWGSKARGIRIVTYDSFERRVESSKEAATMQVVHERSLIPLTSSRMRGFSN